MTTIMLISNDADIDALDNGGRTPLGVAQTLNTLNMPIARNTAALLKMVAAAQV